MPVGCKRRTAQRDFHNDRASQDMEQLIRESQLPPEWPVSPGPVCLSLIVAGEAVLRSAVAMLKSILITKIACGLGHNAGSDFNQVDAGAQGVLGSRIHCQLAQDVFPILARLQERGETFTLQL